jgi:hypothetical protein
VGKILAAQVNLNEFFIIFSLCKWRNKLWVFLEVNYRPALTQKSELNGRGFSLFE